MNNIWIEIKEEIRKISPIIYDTINDSANKEEIESLKEKLNLKIPKSFEDYLSTLNGQSQGEHLIGYNNFMSISEIIKDWECMNNLFLDEKPIEFINENKIKPLFWNNKWIPFAVFEGTTRLLIDFDAGKNGVNGQIIELYPGCDLESDACVISNSFEEFNEKILKSFTNNDFKIEEGVIEIDWLI